MSSEASVLPEPAPVRRRPIGIELALVALIGLAVLLPGIWSYTLIDPWETHYGEVARRMLQDDDFVHLNWQNEGFRSKPVLTFWLMAGSMKALGVADGGGYSGEMVSSGTVMLAIRLPFVLFGVLGLCAAWWMVARMAGRRAAWLGLLVLGTTPFYLFVARQGITDMTLVGSMIGAIAMFAVANEVGDEPIGPLWRFGRRREIAIDHRHVFALIVGGFLLWQVFYYIGYFSQKPKLGGVRLGAIHPGLLISLPMLAGMALLALLEVDAVTRRLRIKRVLQFRPTATSRQIYMLWFYAFLGVSVLGKGLPALGIVGIVCFFYVLLLDRWRALAGGAYEILRGIVLIALIAVPWHVAMWFKDGRRFLHEYFVTHLWNRAAVGVHGERGTFDFYLSQIGYGMFLWAALLPAALAALVFRTRTDTPEGRARFVVATWAVSSMAFFSIVQTKFHHYILPAIPAFALAIGFWLDDVLSRRARGLGLAALVGAGIVLVIGNDMMGEPKQWIEMFIYRYDRPWPSAAPWQIEVSDAFLGLGVAGALALALFTVPRLEKVAVAAVACVAIAIAGWSMHVYMPVAATHWGQRDAVREYYDSREIHGARLVYYGARQVAEDWGRGDAVRDTWTVRTHVPENVQEGQPATVRITVKSVDDRKTEHELRLVGAIDRVDADAAEIRIRLPEAELAKLAPIVAAGRNPKTGKRSARAPVRVVDADRLIAWQLYWRGENFWSGDEIWGRLPEMQTAFKDTDNVKFLKYINDRELCPEGRRYWIITEAGRATNLKTILPTARAKETFQIENTDSNKFSLASFVL
jgi:4-amino-4-deoxy-L-arabinose transferase-like glycosyltransferase